MTDHIAGATPTGSVLDEPIDLTPSDAGAEVLKLTTALHAAYRAALRLTPDAWMQLPLGVRNGALSYQAAVLAEADLAADQADWMRLAHEG